MQRSITALYKRLPTLATSLKASIAREQVWLRKDSDLIIDVQHVARTLIRHLDLPDAQVIVAFRRMSQAGCVELGAGPAYFVDLESRYESEWPDIPAVLAHEVTHVLLHRLNLRFADTHENELLTDTAAVYLGIGWLLLDAFRIDVDRQVDGRVTTTVTSTSKLGYLTPEEFGYVLAKRSLALGEKGDAQLSGEAKKAYRRGLSLARQDYRRPPLSASSRIERLQYVRDRRLNDRPGRPSTANDRARPSRDYEFDTQDGSKVVFRCPTCHHKLRLPVMRKVTVRCSVCQARLVCAT